jgi:hypothetical protein
MSSSDGERGLAGSVERMAPTTVARLFLASMRKHDRAAALLHHDGAKWRETPDWRLERQVIRLGLFLRERAGFVPGDRMAIVSGLRPELVVAELAAAAQGAASVVLDPALSGPELAAALEALAPAAVLVADPAALERLRYRARALVCFDGHADGASPWSEALDLGGTLDTPERAQSFRAQARGVAAEERALGQLVRSDAAAGFEFLTQGEAMTRVRAVRRAAPAPAKKGDVVYLAGRATLAARLEVLSFVGDGFTTAVLGTPGRELAEIAELRPQRVSAPEHVVGIAARAAPPKEKRRWWWIDRVLRPFSVPRS